MRRLAPTLALLMACTSTPDGPGPGGGVDDHGDEDDGGGTDDPGDDTGSTADDTGDGDDPPTYSGRVHAPGGELKDIVGTLVGADVDVHLVLVDDTGAVVETLETTRTDENGEFRFASGPHDPSNLVVVATTAGPGSDAFSRPHMGYPAPPVGTAVDIDPVSEFVTDALTDMTADERDTLEAGALGPVIDYARAVVDVPEDVITVQDAVDEVEAQAGPELVDLVDAVGSGGASDRLMGSFAVHVFATSATDTAWRIGRVQFELAADGTGGCMIDEMFVEELQVEETCDSCTRQRTFETESDFDDGTDCTYAAYASGLVLIDLDGQQLSGALSPDGTRLDLSIAAGLDDQGIGLGFRQTGGVTPAALAGDRVWLASYTSFPEAGAAAPAESPTLEWASGAATVTAQSGTSDGWVLEGTGPTDTVTDPSTCSSTTPLDADQFPADDMGGTGTISDRGRLFWTPYFSTVGFPGVSSASGSLTVLQDGAMADGVAGWVLSAPAIPGLTTADLAGSYWLRGIGEAVTADDTVTSIMVRGTLDVSPTGAVALEGRRTTQLRSTDCAAPASTSSSPVNHAWTWSAADGRFTGASVTGLRDGDGGLVFLETEVSDDAARRMVYVAIPKAE